MTTAPGSGLPTGTVTFLFTDIEGSTNLARTLAERWPDVLAEHHTILRDAVEASGGIVIRTEGDAVFAVFASPTDAVTATARAQRELAAHPWPTDGEIRVRMGMHTGEGRLGGEDYVGLDVHRAARIAAAGHGGQVLLSDTTRALLGAGAGAASVRDLGSHRLKDFDDPAPIFQLVLEDLRTEFPPLRTLEIPSTLPVQLTSFVGRQRELEEIAGLLERARLVTLTGAGGSGKTRLAVRAASAALERFPDGVFFVELAGIAEPDLVPGVIAAAVGTGERGPVPLMDALRIALRDRTMLLVLDNFEQVLEAAPTVGAILAAAPRVRVLATSRGPLRIEGERELAVAPLGLPVGAEAASSEAVALFLDRASAVVPGFALTEENTAAIVEICRRLDGLPLAIELAASRLRLMSPESMLGRLDRALPLLVSGSRDLPARQRTLRGAIEWSHQLLAPEVAGLFRRIAVFAGGFTVPAAEAVAGDDLGIDPLEGLDALLDTGLVRRRVGPTGDVRFETLQTVREFGLERLEDAGEGALVRDRHAGHYLELAQALEPDSRGPQLARFMRILAQEHDNIRGALAWTIETDRADLALPLVWALWRFWHLHGDLTAGRRWIEQVLALPSAAERSLARARGFSAAGDLAYWQQDIPAMSSAYEQALAMFEELRDTAGIALGTYSMAFVRGMTGDIAGAAELFRSAKSMFESLGDQRGVADSLFGLSIASRMNGDLETARATGEEGLRIHQARGDLFGIFSALYPVGRAAAEMGELDVAGGHFLEALAMAEGNMDPTGLSLALDNLADLAIRRGEAARGIRLAGAAQALKESTAAQAPPELVQLPDPRARVHDLLTPEEIDEAWDQGRSMTPDQILAYARSGG